MAERSNNWADCGAANLGCSRLSGGVLSRDDCPAISWTLQQVDHATARCEVKDTERTGHLETLCASYRGAFAIVDEDQVGRAARLSGTQFPVPHLGFSPGLRNA